MLNSGFDPANTDPQLLGSARAVVALNLLGVALAPVFGAVYATIASPLFAWMETRDVGISRAIIGMAHTLGLTVVAEGVEDEAQQEFLTSNSCDALQGYLFGRAVPAREFEARWLPAPSA